MDRASRRCVDTRRSRGQGQYDGQGLMNTQCVYGSARISFDCADTGRLAGSVPWLHREGQSRSSRRSDARRAGGRRRPRGGWTSPRHACADRYRGVVAARGRQHPHASLIPSLIATLIDFAQETRRASTVDARTVDAVPAGVERMPCRCRDVNRTQVSESPQNTSGDFVVYEAAGHRRFTGAGS